MLIAAYAAGLIAITLLGANLPRFFQLSHTRTQLIMSFVSGIMLGVAVFHLLPHAVYSSDASVDFVALWLMGGLLGMFFLQRLFHFHHHEFDELVVDESDHQHAPPTHDLHHHHEPHQHDHALAGSESIPKAGAGVFLGLLIHSLIDGVVLASAIQADIVHHAKVLLEGAELEHGLTIAGLGVFVAIMLHKPLDALTLSVFLKQADRSRFKRLMILIGYAAVCPITAALLLSSGINPFAWFGGHAISAALAFSTGIFLCIALSDLLPEIHFHNHDRFKMTLMLLLGVAAAYAIRSIETDSRHQHVHAASEILLQPVAVGHALNTNERVEQHFCNRSCTAFTDTLEGMA